MIRKKIWMLFLITGSLTLFTNCSFGDVDYVHTVSYEYQNHTGVDLVMEVYNRYNQMIRVYSIPNKDKVMTNTTRKEGPVLFSFENKKGMFGAEIIIKFKDGKCTYYNKENRIFKLKEYDNYSSELIKKRKYKLTYKITSDDYNKAVRCK